MHTSRDALKRHAKSSQWFLGLFSEIQLENRNQFLELSKQSSSNLIVTEGHGTKFEMVFYCLT